MASATHRFVHPRVAEVAGYLGDTRARLLEAASAIPAERYHDRPGSDSWTAGEVLEHLRLVEQGVGRLFAKVIPELQAAGDVEVSTGSILHRAAGLRAVDRGRRLAAPDRVAPRASLDHAAGVAALAATRASLLDALAAGDGLALGARQWPHQVLGELDLYQWLVFVGAHEERHAAQLREIASMLRVMRGDTRA